MKKKEIKAAAVEALQSARELFRDGKRWTQDENAKTQDGEGVPYDSEDAYCFCIGGAVLRHIAEAHPNRTEMTRAKIFDEAEMLFFKATGEFKYFPPFNDKATTSIRDVRKVLDKTIKVGMEEIS